MTSTSSVNQQIEVPVDGMSLEGQLQIPDHASGIVVFAHGSGSSRFSPRNNFVATELRAAGLGTLLIDLLTKAEDLDYERRFDIPTLSRRVVAVCQWLADHPPTRSLHIGLFGASTGAAAALEAAAALPHQVGAVVSRGGRPDLASDQALNTVRCPTLLIVGGRDDVVIELNQRAKAHLRCPSDMIIVRGATHLFEETGALEQVATLAARWFSLHLVNHATPHETSA